MKTVKAFEGVATIVLESLNEADPEKRKAEVKKALDDAFNPELKDKYQISFDIRKASATENPQGWLVYSVLSIVDNPSDEITPLGRLRALELLDIYPAKELAEGFRSERYKSRFHNGYDRVHTPRLPYTFCSREERLQANHKDIWEENPNIQKLIVKAADGWTIDWRATATAVISNKPEEAVQVALLFMHHYNLTEGGLAILQSVPKLDKETLSRMFGKKATFLIEHKLAQGMKVEDLINEGAGITKGVTSDLEEESLSREDILKLLRRERRGREDLKEELVRAEAKVSELMWEKMQADMLIQRQAEELNYWRAGQRPAKVQVESDVVDKLDPKGYYRLLRLHPAYLKGLRGEEVQELIKRHYLFCASVAHPDKGGDTETMQLINEAYETLGDPKKRGEYGK